MAVDSVYGLSAVDVGGTVCGGMTSTGQPSNIITEEIATDGGVHAVFQALLSRSPQPTFTTHSIATMAGLAGVNGKDISTLSNGVIFYAQKRAQAGIREGVTSHVKFAYEDGILIPTALSATQEGSATITYIAHVIASGSSDPETITDNQSLPTLDNQDERFGIGSVTLGGVIIDRVTSVEVDFGITVNVLMADGEIFPKFASIDTIFPIITIQTRNAEFSAADITMDGVDGTLANTIIYLRKRASASQYVADVNVEHVKMTASGLITIEDSQQASGNDPSDTTIKIACISKSAADPLTMEVAAIT